MTFTQGVAWAITFRALGAENQECSHSLGSGWVQLAIADVTVLVAQPEPTRYPRGGTEPHRTAA